MNIEYQKYLKSEDWKRKRLEKHTRANGSRKRCAICGSREKLDVHHLLYKRNLEEVEQTDLRILCRRCHELTHKLIKEGKIRFKNTNHHSRFAITYHAVKRELGDTFVSFFPRKNIKQDITSENTKTIKSNLEVSIIDAEIFLLGILQSGEWVEHPVIQGQFKTIFGNPKYKEAMASLRRTHKVEYLYHTDKKYWMYRLARS